MNDRPDEESIRALLRSAAPGALPGLLRDRVSAIPQTVVIPAQQSRVRWGFAGAFAALATMLVIASALLIAPRPTFLFGSASATPPPSKTATAVPSNSGPITVCGDVPASYKGVFVPFLTCGEAVSAALRSLPKEHPDVARIEFGFGDYCGPTTACPSGIDLLSGYVLVTYATGPRMLILVRDESAQTGVSITSSELLP